MEELLLKIPNKVFLIILGVGLVIIIWKMRPEIGFLKMLFSRNKKREAFEEKKKEVIENFGEENLDVKKRTSDLSTAKSNLKKNVKAAKKEGKDEVKKCEKALEIAKKGASRVRKIERRIIKYS